MKNKIKTCLFALIIIGVITLGLTYNKKNDITKTKKKKQSNIAIMIKEDGEENYTRSSSKDIPKGENYYLDYEKSYCKNNGVIGEYDNTLGKVSFSFIGTDSCFLYFEEFIKPSMDNAEISYYISESKIMTIDIIIEGYYFNEHPKFKKFICYGVGDTLEQTKGPFVIDLNTLNLDSGEYILTICGIDLKNNEVCTSASYTYE